MSTFEKLQAQRRTIAPAKSGDDELGPLQLLPGVWKNLPNLPGRGWNLIALPFASPDHDLNYRLLMNQYNEVLRFTTVDKAVPNRGLTDDDPRQNIDQLIVTLDYEQKIVQVAAEDFPDSGLAGLPGLAIHHEPGLFLHMSNADTDGVNIGRLATIPHGNSALGLGRFDEDVHKHDGPPRIPDEVHAFPIGVEQDINRDYLLPYKHFNENLFENLFDPMDTSRLLQKANAGANILRTTELHLDTDILAGGIVNIPFIETQADATKMESTFWIQELEEKDEDGEHKLRLQYLQIVMLDFFERPPGQGEGLIRWPHISINTMERVEKPETE
ncbi:hypothetical protein Mal52_13340 [Symmachiella dynata]|uniref:Uncharacterized protein n=1 Tax=Symmachiella dynata TaxID=2527995 RepID=A0A517ZK91_9PLAN|nr:heme-binding protein [Symmachiella dynata]QDU42865.1 hypothetical protein Mal52_13340 [Symmachiella dynata]